MVKSSKWRDLTIVLLVSASVVVAVQVLSMVYFRADLTTEKRHSLTESTENTIEALEDNLYIKVYLAGELPANMERLREATQQLLDNVRALNPKLVNYQFLDPNEDPDEKTRNRTYQQLVEQGLKHSVISLPGKGEKGQKIIFPGAIVSYQGNDVPIQLLKSEIPRTDAAMITASINNLEYEFIGGIREVISGKRKKIAVLQGHGELNDVNMLDLTRSLEQLYDVHWVSIDSQVNSLSEKIEGLKHRRNLYDALIVARPSQTINKKDRYILDQYVMNGGKVLWMLDPMNAHLDSLRKNQMSMATPYDLGLEDMLFSYGVRLNNDLIIDRSCSMIDVVTGQFGDRPKIESFPFYFEPILVPLSHHPIVYNIDPVQVRFASSLDTVASKGIKKTVLLKSSKYSRIFKNPVRISLDIVRLDPDFGDSTQRNIAVLLEGEFQSPYTDRLPKQLVEDPEMAFRDRSPHTAMIVISDGGLPENRPNKELGFDRYANRRIYGNKEFILNALNYLLDDNSLISLRSRTITLRPLDPERIVQQRTLWQVLNVGLPLLLVVVIGSVLALLRKWRYSP